MYCGSCLHDNTLVAALRRLGHDALLIPTYTPIRTDETDQTASPVFFGGINVFLQQKSFLFRHTPWFLDRWLNSPRLLRWVSKLALGTSAEKLGPLTLSMLKGLDGFQAKEVNKLARWLKEEIKPDIIHLTNALLSGVAKTLNEKVGVPVVCSLQGDDIFLEALTQRHGREARQLISANSRFIDGFLSTSTDYANFMAEYLPVPRVKIDVVIPGLDLKYHPPVPRTPSGPPVIGYFARICPEKGLHHLVNAWLQLRKTPAGAQVKLHIGGWLGESSKAYFHALKVRVQAEEAHNDFFHFDCPDMAAKVDFFQRIDVLSVPSDYREPKGLYVLEAWAHGVPVVQPAHGSFPELLSHAGEAGLLFSPGDDNALFEILFSLVNNRERLIAMGQNGRRAAESFFHADRMARETADFYQKWIPRFHGKGQTS